MLLYIYLWTLNTRKKKALIDNMLGKYRFHRKWQYILQIICRIYSVSKSHEIMLLVCLQEDAKQCGDAKELDRQQPAQ